jgi:putative transcriptional regulator
MNMVQDRKRRTHLEDSLVNLRAFKAGNKTQVRTYSVRVPETVDVKKVRQKLKLPQEAFATRYGFKVATLRDWEQGRRKPDRSARILLTVLDKEPEAIERALAKAHGKS